MEETALELQKVVKRFGRRIALNELDLQVPRGSVVGLVGSNGAGKTTALAVIAGLLKPNSGSIDILGQGPFDPAKHAGRLTLMPQDSELPREANVYDLLVFYACLQGLSKKEAEKTAEETINWVHLADRVDSTIHTLSHGMRRRVVLAQAFLGRPELVLLDEPMSGLDPKEVVNIRAMLKNRKGRQTIVVSSHNLHEIERICDRIAFIENGVSLRQDSLDTITGTSCTVTCRIAGGQLPMTKLHELLPDALVALNDDGTTLICTSRTDKLTSSFMSRTILQCLLDANIDVVQMRQGSELESAYLHGETGR